VALVVRQIAAGWIVVTLVFRRIAPDAAPAVEMFADYTVFQTAPWLRFLAQGQGAEIVAARIERGDECVGRFTGAIFRKAGLRVLGAPFPGSSTSYMGFNLIDGVPRQDALLALRHFAFRHLGCVYLEVMDRRLEPADVPAGFASTLLEGYEVDLTPNEDVLFAAFDPACRRNIRKSEREGVRVEQASDPTSFATEYYSQLTDVFAKQGLKPTYTEARVRALINTVHASGRLLLVRATRADGAPIASAIFAAANDLSYFWGGASWREHQHLRPNEAVMWFAMRYWRARGITRFDFGGDGDYKKKYGGRRIAVPWVRAALLPWMERFRELARRAYSR
jgi:CelD/BcsL family acetyltransferase involved in cellulose biosynthesis